MVLILWQAAELIQRASSKLSRALQGVQLVEHFQREGRPICLARPSKTKKLCKHDRHMTLCA